MPKAGAVLRGNPGGPRRKLSQDLSQYLLEKVRGHRKSLVSLGWVVGFEPTATGTTRQPKYQGRERGARSLLILGRSVIRWCSFDGRGFGLLGTTHLRSFCVKVAVGHKCGTLADFTLLIRPDDRIANNNRSKSV